MSDSDSDPDVSKLAREVIAELDSGRYGDKFVFSRRQVIALAGAGLSVGALTTLGVDEATAQEAVGQVGTASEPVDVEAAGVNAGSVSTDEGTITSLDGTNLQYETVIENEGPVIKTWTQAGADADARLDNALIAASAGDVIYLEAAEYTSDRTVSSVVKLIGTGGKTFESDGSRISGDTTWTLSESGISLSHINVDGTDTGDKIAVGGDLIQLTHIGLRSASDSEITISSNGVLLSHIFHNGSVTFESTASDGEIGIVAGNITITDNGTNSVL